MDQAIPSTEGSVDLLWTGGWDSTFQLLRLLIGDRRRVTPYYFIDTKRRSTGVELLTIDRIKTRLSRDYPYTCELLEPTKYFARADIEPDSEISEAYRALLTERFMGNQYEWLPRFCKQNNIDGIQLCIHRDDKAHFFVERITSESLHDWQNGYLIDPESKGTAAYTLFHYFSFPLLDLTKLEMAAIADDNGWRDLMEMTWFCYEPTRRMKPCGKCNPCHYAIQEGLGWRVPFRGRLAGLVDRSAARPLRRWLKTWRAAQTA